jgi:hypothetical protein
MATTVSLVVTVPLVGQSHFLVGHHIDKGPLRVALDGGGRDQGDIAQCVNNQFRVDKLVGEQVDMSSLSNMALIRMVPVPVSIMLSSVRKVPVASLRESFLVVGLDLHFMAGFQLALDGGQIFLIHAENHRDGLKLRNDDDRVGVGGVDDVARIDQAQARPPGNGSMDEAVGQLHFRIGQLALVNFTVPSS